MYLKIDISFSASLFHSEVISNLAVTYFLQLLCYIFILRNNYNVIHICLYSSNFIESRRKEKGKNLSAKVLLVSILIQ